MKQYKYLLWGLMVLVGLVSCKENMMEEEDTGSLMLKVSTLMPKAAKNISSDNTGNFPVLIKGETGTPVANVSKEYVSVNSIPNGTVMLPIGRYVVSAHSPIELKKQMDQPYFAGVAPLEILKDVTSKATVTCKMKNSKIQVRYSENFKKTFARWIITIDDNSESVLTFTEEIPNPDPIYYFLGDKGAEKLNVNIKAETFSGNTIVEHRVLTKSQAGESYDEDTPNFVGGDGLNLNMDISGTPSGNISIQIGVKIEFTESQDDVDVSVGDNHPGHDVDPDFGDGDQPAGDTPRLEFPASQIIYSLGNDPSKPKPTSADALLKTPLGLKSAKVKIVTDSQGFRETLEGVDFDETGALLSGAELIGNVAMQQLFDSLGLKDAQGQSKKTPLAGETEYVFPMSAFFMFLDMFEGNHVFQITLEDLNGNKVEGNLTIKIIP